MDPGHEFSVTVEDGVEVATTSGGPRQEGEIFAYERTLVIRPAPEVEASFLYSPYWMAMAGDGRNFVGDMGDEQVVVFSGEGEYLYRIGRGGQGPGELQRVGFVDVIDDVLWVTETLSAPCLRAQRHVHRDVHAPGRGARPHE